MKLTISHYYSFGEQAGLVGENLLTAEAWDNLRTTEEDTPFSVPENRACWVAKCEASDFAIKYAQDILSVLQSLGFNRVVSLGVGGAFLEYQLKQLAPSLHLTCMDYSPRLIERLRVMFTECESLKVFDLRSPVWPISQGLYLMHRIDTDFSDTEWQSIFANMFAANVEVVLFVVCGGLTPKTFLREKMLQALSFFRRRSITFAGYFRTRDAFKALWTPMYRVDWEVKVGNLNGFLLRRAS
jgi:hypothetical protein